MGEVSKCREGEMRIISVGEMRIISVGEMGVGVMRMCSKGMRNSLLIFHKSENKTVYKKNQ